MEALILSRFDPTYGPKIFLKAPKTLNEELIKEIPSLMELRSKGVFIHIFGELKTANLFFRIPSNYARGGKEGFLISIITDINSNLKLILTHEFLKNFAEGIKNIDEAYKAFNIESKNYKGDPNKLEEIKNLFFSFYKSMKPAIKTLDIAEHRYQALFKTAREAIFIIDRELGIIIDANLEAEKLIDQPHDEIVGLNPSQFKIYIKEMVEPNLTMLLSKKDQLPIIIKLRKRDGSKIYLETTINEIQFGDQHLVQFILHDLTKRKLAEKEIQKHLINIAVLNKIISVVNQAENLSELMISVLDSLMGFLNFNGCCIYLVNKLKRQARIYAHKGLPSNYIQDNEILEIDENPINTVFINGVPIYIDTFPEITNLFLEGTPYVTIAIIPLFSRIEIIGSLMLFLKKERIFSHLEKDLFISVSLEIGTAIEKMKNEEFLRQSEARNRFLLENIPFSILRISRKGTFLDVKFSNVLKTYLRPEDFLGKKLLEVFPKKSAEMLIDFIDNSFSNKEFQIKYLTLPIKNKDVIFQVYIDPINTEEALVFLKTITRLW